MDNAPISRPNPLFKIRSELWISLLLVVLTLAVYAPVITHGFVNYDDHLYVYENRHVGQGLTREGVLWAFRTTHGGNWHPLTWLSHMLDVHLYGLNPGMHHRINLLLHTANTLLLFFVLVQMTGSGWKSGFVAALFSIHPLHVESVAWISERKDVLSTFFFMLALLAYAGWVKRRGIQKGLGVVAFFVLGLLAKPMVVTLPCVLLLLDCWPLRRISPGSRGLDDFRETLRKGSRLILEKIPLFIISAGVSLVTILAMPGRDAYLSQFIYPWPQRVENALISYAGYLSKTIWPFDLAVFYPFPGEFPLWKTSAAVALLVLVSTCALKSLHRHPYVAIGWFWYVGTLVPVIGFLQQGSQAMADRYTYIPLIGLFIILAWGVPDLLARWRHRRGFLVALPALVLLLLVPAARFQVGLWSSSITLFRHAAAVTENNYLAHYLLGNALVMQGRLEQGIGQYMEALRIDPNISELQNNLGVALVMAGRTETAVAHFEAALRIKPDHNGLRNNLERARASLKEAGPNGSSTKSSGAALSFER